MSERTKMVGVICGGVIPESEFKEDQMAFLMCLILKDKDYEKYQRLVKERRFEEAHKLIRRKAWSTI